MNLASTSAVQIQAAPGRNAGGDKSQAALLVVAFTVRGLRGSDSPYPEGACSAKPVAVR